MKKRAGLNPSTAASRPKVRRPGQAGLRALNAQLRQAAQQRRALEGRLLEISEREQHRIGQELHDDVCSQLSGVEYLVRALARELAAVSKTQARRATKIARLLQAAMASAHRLAHGLSPLALDAHGLRAGLKELVAHTREVYRCRCSFRGEDRSEVADGDRALHLYRIAQEAVTNAARHSGAKAIGVSLATQGDGVILRVSDNGRGLAHDPGPDKGLGLLTMRARAAAVGGSLVVRRNRRGGTDVVCRVASSLEPAREKHTP